MFQESILTGCLPLILLMKQFHTSLVIFFLNYCALDWEKFLMGNN